MERNDADRLLTQLYEGNGLFAKIIDTPADEAFRNGVIIKGNISADGIEYATDYLEWLHWDETATAAVKWARLYGGSVVVMLIDDGGGINEPLNWDNIRSVDGLRVYDRSIIRPDHAGFDGSRHRMPEHYHIFSQYGTFTAHASRCLVFRNGSRLHERSTEMHLWPWAIPEGYRIMEALQNAEVSHGNAVRLLDRSIQPIHKIRGLSQMLATSEGMAQVGRQMEVVDLARGLFNTIAVDIENDYNFRGAIPEGIGKIVDVSDRMLSAVTGIPEIILWGKPIGYNNPGHSWAGYDYASMRNWQDYISRIQGGMIRHNLSRLLSVIFQVGVNCGKFAKVPPFQIQFISGLNGSELRAQRRHDRNDHGEDVDIALAEARKQLAKAKTAEMYMDMGVIQPGEVRKSLYRK